MLPVRRFGSGPPLLALHGFTYTGRQFGELSTLLDYTILAPDLPGHGGASHATTAWPVVLDALAGISPDQNVPLIAYSQGARIALAAAAKNRISPAQLVIISGTAGIDDATERQARLESDRQTAIRLLETGIDEFLDSWTASGLTSTHDIDLDRRDSDMEIRRENTEEGLASALVGYGQGAMPPVWDELDGIACPTLFISGSEDEKYRTIADKMATRVAGSEHRIIDGAGHNPILGHPAEVANAVSGFLDRDR